MNKTLAGRVLASLVLCLLLSSSALAASSKEDLQDRIDAAKTVLNQIMAAGDRSIPMNIMDQATCVGVVPGLIKGAFVFGAQYGQGVVTCRTGKGWSAPVFIRMAGGSWGLQVGGQSTDLVLIAVNDHGFQDLLKNKFKIGGDAAASAGPVGRNTQASTDWKMNAELLTYSRSKGVFAGVSLDGTVVSQNKEDTEIYFGHPHSFQAILKGDIAPPAGSVDFVKDVARYFMEARHGEETAKAKK
jgi:lipid-binding SYLF domain-containing protein